MPTVVERHRSQGKIYAIDSVGKPLTPAMAQALREGVLAASHKRALPHLIARGLAQQPNAPYVPPRAPDDPWPYTPEGLRIRELLGRIPPEHVTTRMWGNRVLGHEYATRYCPTCRTFVDARLIAWGTSSRECINCLEENA